MTALTTTLAIFWDNLGGNDPEVAMTFAMQIFKALAWLS